MREFQGSQQNDAVPRVRLAERSKAPDLRQCQAAKDNVKLSGPQLWAWVRIPHLTHTTCLLVTFYRISWRPTGSEYANVGVSCKQGVGGVMVSIAAFQAVDLGSIPGQRRTSLLRHNCEMNNITFELHTSDLHISFGSVAEWSKALVLGTSHFDDVGSNLTAA